MWILAHRGLWEKAYEQNKIESFSKALERGHGVELDIRAYNGQIVVSHDSPRQPHLEFSKILNLFAESPVTAPLAINVKEDGLAEPAMRLLEDRSISDYFFFDMSIPDAICYLRRDAVLFTRHSEYEHKPYLYENCSGIWLDCFEGCWFDEELIVRHMRNGKDVVVVSAELHGREKTENWDVVNAANLRTVGAGSRLMLCTDYPQDASEVFNVQYKSAPI